MFNSTSYRAGDVTNTLKINACSGGIYKTYKESWFTRFNLKSKIADTLFRPYDNELQIDREKTKEYSFGGGYYTEVPKQPVVILQMIICGDMEVIAEVIKEEDFYKYFENKDLLEKEGK